MNSSRNPHLEREISVEERILLTNLWKLPTKLRNRLSFQQNLVSDLITFLDHTDEHPEYKWRDLFTCNNLQRQHPNRKTANLVTDQKFEVHYNNCSLLYLQDIADLDAVERDASKKHTVSILLRVNYILGFYHCLVRLNEPDFWIKNPDKKKQWTEFLPYAGVKVRLEPYQLALPIVPPILNTQMEQRT